MNLPDARSRQRLFIKRRKGAGLPPYRSTAQESLEILTRDGSVLSIELTQMKALGRVQEVNPQGMHLAELDGQQP
jgi:hypothetical protein